MCTASCNLQGIGGVVLPLRGLREQELGAAKPKSASTKNAMRRNPVRAEHTADTRRGGYGGFASATMPKAYAVRAIVGGAALVSSQRDLVDDLILSHASCQWQKVAMVVAKTSKECDDKGIKTDYNEIALEIRTLVVSGRLDARGDLSDWRHSEVRLPK